MRLFRSIILAAAAAALPALSYGGILTYNDRASFDAAVGGPTLEDFELGHVSPADFIECSSPMNSSTNDSCFSPGEIVSGLEINNNGVGHGGAEFVLVGANFFLNSSTMVMQNFSGDTLNLVFSVPVAAVAFDLYSLLGTDPFDVSIAGVAGPLTTFSPAPGFAGAFFGITSTDPITSLSITSSTGDYIGIDNVAFTPAPEPGTISVVTAAVLMLAGWRKFGRSQI
jgi:hypothetical protein